MLREAFIATGQQVNILTKVEFYVESRPNNPTNFVAELLKLTFFRSDLLPLNGQGHYRAIYIDLGNSTRENASWSLNRIQLNLSVQAESNTIFVLYLLDGYTLFTTIDTPSTYQYYRFNPTFTVVYYPYESQEIFPEMLPRSNASMVLVASTGSFGNVRVSNLDLVYLPTHSPMWERLVTNPANYFVFFTFFLFLLPLGMALLIYLEFFQKERPNLSGMMSALLTGLVSRFALAPITSHVFDMRVFLISARGWFQYGSSAVSPGPALPSTFFLYWIPYSFYALGQKLGFTDFFVPHHDAGLVEAVFIKLFPIVADVVVFSILLRIKPGGKMLVWASIYFLNPMIIFASSVRGHYDAAALAMIVAGGYWTFRQKTVQAALAFTLSAILQVIGIIPFFLLLMKTNLMRQYKILLLPFGTVLPILVYPPERDLFVQLFMGFSGITKSQFSAGNYTLLGSLGLSPSVWSIHPLIVMGGFLGTLAFYDATKDRLQLKSLLFYTCLAFLALLLLTDEPYAWTWLIPVGLVYSIIADNDNLPFFLLVSGSMMCFLVISYTTGFGYYLTGSNVSLMLPWTENVRNGIEIFTVMTVVLSGFFLAYLRNIQSSPRQTFVRSSLFVIASYMLVYFWVGVYVL